MWSFDLVNESLNWNDVPILWYYGSETNLEIGVWDGAGDITNYPGIKAFEITGVKVLAGVDVVVSMTIDIDQLTEALANYIVIPWLNDVVYDSDSYIVTSIIGEEIEVKPATLIYFNKLSKVKTIDFVGEEVTLEDFTFVAGIMKDGVRVTPAEYENLSPLELYAITGQFFDLNSLEDSDWQRPRILSLKGLRSIYDSGLIIPPYPTIDIPAPKPPLLVSNRSGWHDSRVNYDAGIRSDINISLRPRDTYIEMSRLGSVYLNENYPIMLQFDPAIPFENMEHRRHRELTYEPWGVTSAAYINGYLTPKSDGVTCFSIFGVHFAIIRKFIGGDDLSGFSVTIDFISSFVGFYQASVTDNNIGYFPLKSGFAQRGGQTSLAYSEDLEEIKAFVTAEKTRLAL